MRDEYAAVGIVLIVGVCSYLGYEVIRMNQLINAGAVMTRNAVKFERPIEGKNEILIIGDSLAYGVGVTKPEDSFAGVLADSFDNKAIVNKAEIGETIGSLENSIDEKLATRYERVYIIVGGNDIMRMHINILNSKDSLKTLVRDAAQSADRVFLVTTGDFENVSLSPWLLKQVFEIRSNMIRSTALELELEISNFDYIDFQSENIGKYEYKLLEAADGFHLNEQGIQRLVSTIIKEEN